MSFLWHELSGKEGQITIPSLGAVIGKIDGWTLKRREESAPGNPGLLTLRASLSYVNPVLFNQPLTKKVVIRITKDLSYEVRADSIQLEGSSLTMEEAELCRLE